MRDGGDLSMARRGSPVFDIFQRSFHSSRTCRYTLAQVYQFADQHNSTFVGGYSETVGASGGWLMGGGHSVLSPTLGLGVDRVKCVHI
ncbi:hypothetical protein B0H16DRAFT_740282 [Mycena metata]|uniref:Uncharacterized protein n=1 Tax=Mycena metata TaxID=1033252 RepID=A0AAD7GQA3_9AGAR|nr:hypothetical protein B0H16DRAFT_740282 [Mycena metata]